MDLSIPQIPKGWKPPSPFSLCDDHWMTPVAMRKEGDPDMLIDLGGKGTRSRAQWNDFHQRRITNKVHILLDVPEGKVTFPEPDTMRFCPA